MTRKRFGYRDLFAIAARQVQYWPPKDGKPAEIGIACVICGEPILPGQQVDLDHGDPVGFGSGRDIPSNVGFVHSDPCHKDKTRRDKTAMSKADRQGGRRGSQTARRERKGPTMQSRPMQKPADVGRRYDWKTGRMENATS